ncbi:MAG: hypothetical protein NTY47_05205 [Candidatus Omnitrophica bacterium]|nr:hypothetical protein [Candidatus Omnitrophota bacterium]
MNKIRKYYDEARERTKQRKSPWNWILFPLSIFGIVGTYLLLIAGLSSIQRHLIPTDVILSGGTAIGNFLMFVPIVFPSLVLGFMFANSLAWFIPPVRRALDKEAKGIKGASFRDSMKLFAIVSIILLIVVTPIGLLGAFNYFYLSSEGIYVKEIETRCLAERNNLHLNYILVMKDNFKIDLFNESPRKFIAAFEQLKPYIKSQRQIVYDVKIGDGDIKQLKRRFSSKYAEKIIYIIRNE